MQPDLKKVLKTIHRRGNSFGESGRKRGSWTAELDFEVADARAEAVDVLWFVGDYASYDPRNQTISRGLAELLTEAGVEFGILFESEHNSGNDIRRIGEEGLFEHLAKANIAASKRMRVRPDRYHRPAQLQYALERVLDSWAETGTSFTTPSYWPSFWTNTNSRSDTHSNGSLPTTTPAISAA